MKYGHQSTTKTILIMHIATSRKYFLYTIIPDIPS